VDLANMILVLKYRKLLCSHRTVVEKRIYWKLDQRLVNLNQTLIISLKTTNFFIPYKDGFLLYFILSCFKLIKWRIYFLNIFK